jgi:hypothetical protein
MNLGQRSVTAGQVSTTRSNWPGEIIVTITNNSCFMRLHRDLFLSSRRLFSCRLIFAFALCLSALPVRQSTAGTYRLVKGAGLPVCEAYRRDLEPRHDAEPMACVREYDPAVGGFSPVPWKQIDVDQNIDLYREAKMNLATNINSAQGTVLSEQDAQRTANSIRVPNSHPNVELYIAEVPLFGKEGASNVLSVRELACGPIPKPNVRISRLFILNKSMTHLDSAKQKRLQGWSNNATLELFDGVPFLETYTPDDNWGTLFSGSGALSVWKHNGRAFELICKISFTPSNVKGDNEVKR